MSSEGRGVQKKKPARSFTGPRHFFVFTFSSTTDEDPERGLSEVLVFALA
jgi:hypothetical protein